MVPTVLLNALQIVKHVDTLTASALVRRDGWDTIVQKVNTNVRRLKIKLPWKTSNLYKYIQIYTNIYLTPNCIPIV